MFSAESYDDHERVMFAADRESGLKAIIAVHNTCRGPAVGGCRMFPYASDTQALDDVLRLSRGMTYKSALAGLPLGGGKSVIIGDPQTDKSPALWRAFARALNDLGGRYIAAEDSGTSVADLQRVAKHSAHVSGIAETEHGGDPSPNTARGVFLAIKVALKHRLGSDDLRGARVAIQGLGHVGFALASMLTEAGAEVCAADVNEENMARAERELNVRRLSTSDILCADVDVFSPCALGGIINSESIPTLRAGIVAGAANNQLHQASDAALLSDRGILYCPDFLINAGGIIDVHYQQSGESRVALPEHVDTIATRLAEVLRRADTTHTSTHAIAEALARELLEKPAACGSPQSAEGTDLRVA